MKKGTIFGFVLAIAIIVFMAAGTTVLDVRRSDGGGVAYSDTFSGVLKGAIYSATSDITVDDIVCNTITPDTAAGNILFTGTPTMTYLVIDSIDACKVHGDLTISAGYEIYCDSAVIDTLGGNVLFTGTPTMTYLVIDSIDACKVHGDLTISAGYEIYCDSAVIDTLVVAGITSTVGITADGSFTMSAGSISMTCDSASYVNGDKDTAWVYINGVKMILAVEP